MVKEQKKQRKEKKTSVIGRNLTIIFFVVVVVLFCLLSALSYRSTKVKQTNVYRKKVYECASYVANTLRGVDLKELCMKVQESKYQSYDNEFTTFFNSMGLKYLYVYIPDEEAQSFTNVFFLDGTENQLYQQGEQITLNVPERARNVYEGKEERAAVITENQFGYVVTAYYPILDASGKIQGIAGVDIDAADIIAEAYQGIWSKAAWLFLLSGVVFIVLLFLNDKYVVKPIWIISNAMQQFVSGHKENRSFQKLNMRRKDEIGVMAAAFDYMSAEMETYLQQIKESAAESEKAKVQMQIAKRIQEEALPDATKLFAEEERFHLAASMRAARQVGGDFYDFFYLASDKVCMVIGDVAGKGITGAMFMMRAKTLLKERALHKEPLNIVLEKTNQELCIQNESGMFVTVLIGILDLKTGRFCYANAGHNPSYICKKRNEFTAVGSGLDVRLQGEFSEMHLAPTCPLGTFDDEKYVQEEVQLSFGDQIFFYTDGVNEAENETRSMFGVQRMNVCLEKWKWESGKVQIDQMYHELETFAEGTVQSDDITMMLLQYEGEARTCWVEAEIKNLQEIRKRINETADEKNVNIKKLQLVAEEVFVNIVSYAYQGGEKKRDSVCFSCRSCADGFEMLFMDRGIPFDPLLQKEPDLDAELENQTEGGYGIFLTRKLMDELEYVRKDGYNVLKVKKINAN